jgi:hypothetical protein
MEMQSVTSIPECWRSSRACDSFSDLPECGLCMTITRRDVCMVPFTRLCLLSVILFNRKQYSAERIATANDSPHRY